MQFLEDLLDLSNLFALLHLLLLSLLQFQVDLLDLLLLSLLQFLVNLWDLLHLSAH
jgi:hypothetical protein